MFDFDANGNKTFWQKRDSKDFIYTYDEINQLETTSVPDTSATPNTILHFYDGLGRPTEVSRGSGNKTIYGYDDRGFLDSSDTNGSEVTYVNDAAGRVTSMTYPDNQVVSYGYDSSSAVTSVDVKQSLSSSTHNVADYVYDNMGRVTDVLLGDNSLTTYQYDDIGRLERHTLADFHITTLGYNPASQIIRRSVTDSTMQTALPNSSPDLYTPNNLNQYTFVDTSNPLLYDLNGNLTDYDGWDYGYDAHNRMQSASGPGSTSLNLTYDPTGRLSSTTLQGSTTSFSYSGNQLIGEYEQVGNSINLTELYVYAPGSDIPLARFSDGSIGSNSVTYLRADERGSIVLETDGTAVLESHQYDAYGVPLNVSDSLFRYTGQIQLKGTELYHYKARAYHPELGRFLQTDPIGYDDGMNMYAYVGNDPVNGVDPTGQRCVVSNASSVYCQRRDIYRGLDGNAKSKTRFFGAAAATVEYLANNDLPIFGNVLGGQAEGFLNNVSTALYSENKKAFNQIMSGALSGKNLDAKMVHMEQTKVQSMIDALPAAERDSIIGRINFAFGIKGLSVLSESDSRYNRVLNGVEKNLGRSIDFGNQSDREAIGNGLIKDLRRNGACTKTGSRLRTC